MLSLIIVLISILIVGALALAAVYYGGAAFSNSGASAHVSTMLNEGSQISAALTTYRVHKGGFPTGTQQQIKDALVSEGYLSAVPSTMSWTLRNDYATVQGVPDAVCLAANKKRGLDHVPACTDPAADAAMVCCSE